MTHTNFTERLNLLREKMSDNRKTMNIIHGIKSGLLITVGILMFFQINTFAQSPSGGSYEKKTAETGNKADQNIKSVARINPHTLAMEFSLPIASYPGRNGNSLGLSVSYSSKVWQLENWDQWFYVNLTGVPRFVTDMHPKFANKSAAGWTSSLLPPRIDEELVIYNQYGKPFDFLYNDSSISNRYQQTVGTILNGGTGQNLSSTPVSCGWGCASYRCTPDGGSNNQHTCNCEAWTYVSGGCPRDPGTWDDTQLPNPNNEPPKQSHYVKRVRVQMPGGSSVEFRKDDKVHGYCIDGSNSNPTICENFERNDKLGDFLAVDGSGMRLNRTETESILYMPNGSRYIFPNLPLLNSQQWYAAEHIDVNGNKTTFAEMFDANSNVVATWTDSMGRKLVDPIPQNWGTQNQTEGTQVVDVPSFDNTTRRYELSWLPLETVLENTTQPLSYETEKVCRGNLADDLPLSGETNGILFDVNQSGTRLCNSFVGSPSTNTVEGAKFNPVVLAGITLPNGQKYEFKYNLYGEISKITYPTGSYETFVYNKITPLAAYNNIVFDQTNRGVTERKVYASNNVLEQRWQYSAGNSGTAYTVTTIAPDPNNPMADGARTESDLISSDEPYPGSQYGNFGFSDPRAGMPKETRSYDELGQMRSRTITEYVNTPARTGSSDPNAIDEPLAVRDPRAMRSVSFTFEPGEAYALATYSRSFYDDDGSTDPQFFSHLNVERTESYEYAAVSVSQAQSTSLSWTAIENWFPPSKLASASETLYTYDNNYKAVGILGLPTATFVLNPRNPDRNAADGVLAKTETIYDYSNSSSNTFAYSADLGYSGVGGTLYCDAPTNEIACWQNTGNNLKGRVTTQRLWDSDHGTNGIWIESHTQYDIFGNGVKTRDFADREAEVVFENSAAKPYKYAYPTRSISPAPGNGTTGTSEKFESETTYDLTTGLVKEVRDLRIINDQNDDLVSTTEYIDDLLRPTAVVTPNGARTETVYNDTPGNLWVKTRSQFDSNVWNEAISYADSLGRAYKTRTIDSNGDIIVESKFDKLGRVTESSNPYREGTSASEILWSKTEYDEAGRVENVYSPKPSGQTGDPIGTTEYGIINTPGIVGVWNVSTDASGRKKRSITNSLGQLTRVDEATSDNSLDPIPQSTPNPTPTPNTSPTPYPTPSSCNEYSAVSCPPNLTGDGEYPSVSTYYKYNVKGEMVEVMQGGQKRNFLYDSLGRLIRVKQPEQEVNDNFDKFDPATENTKWTARLQYDVMGKLIESEDAKGTKITYTYDNADRVLSMTYSDGTPQVTYKYDLINGTLTSGSKGALIETSNVFSTSKTTQIDQWGRPTEYQQITNVGDQANPDLQTYTSKYTYNLSGALIQEEYPSGRVVKNTFDDNGDVSRVAGKATPNAIEKTYANSFNYTASGGISAMKLGNGRWETAKFNNRLQVDELGLGNASQDASLWKVNYELGELNTDGTTVDTAKNTGNIAKQTISFNGLSQPFVQTYKYDSLFRLTNANEKAGSTENWKQNFTYDRYGNRLTHDKFINNNLVANNSQTHPSIDPNTNRITSNGYSYDKVGNLIVDGEGRTFTFDGNNKQTFVYDGNQTVGEYFYDGSGMRVKKKRYFDGQHTETVIFAYSGGKLVEEFSTKTPPTDKKTKYLTEDHLGTPRVITDQNGAVITRRDFMPFGEDLYNGVGARDSALKYNSPDDDVRQKFTGYQKDEETQLDFAEARMYENRHARFTAVDPLLASGNSANPQTFNRFVYVTNSPMQFTDPTGLFGWLVTNGQLKYDSSVNDAGAASEKYGVGTLYYGESYSAYEEDGATWELLRGGSFTRDGVSGSVRDWANIPQFEEIMTIGNPITFNSYSEYASNYVQPGGGGGGAPSTPSGGGGGMSFYNQTSSAAFQRQLTTSQITNPARLLNAAPPEAPRVSFGSSYSPIRLPNMSSSSKNIFGQNANYYSPNEFLFTDQMRMTSLRANATSINRNGIQKSIDFTTIEGEKYILNGNHRTALGFRFGKPVPAIERPLPYGHWKNAGEVKMYNRMYGDPSESKDYKRFFRYKWNTSN